MNDIIVDRGDQYKAEKASIDQNILTLAGIGVASFCRSPGKIVVEILTLFTVQTFSVVVTHAVTMNLQTHNTVKYTH